MTVRDYHRALPLGEHYAEAEAEFKADGYVRPERQPVGAGLKHETHIADGAASPDVALEGDASTDQYLRDVGERLAREIRVATDGHRVREIIDEAERGHIQAMANGLDLLSGDLQRTALRGKRRLGELLPKESGGRGNCHPWDDSLSTNRRYEYRLLAALDETEFEELLTRETVPTQKSLVALAREKKHVPAADAVAAAVPAVSELREAGRLTNSDIASVVNVEMEVVAAAAPLVAEGRAGTLRQAVKLSDRTAHAHRTDEECDEREKANSADIDAGPMPRAALLSEEREQRQGAGAERHRADMARQSFGKVELYYAGIAELHQDVAAGSVDIIYTEAPREPDFVPLYGDLGRFAAHALKDGGLLLALGGAMYLPQLHRHLEGVDGIQYHWQFVYSMPGASTPMREPRVHQTCQVLIAYSKGAYTGEWHADLVTMPGVEEQKRQLRCWQQQAAVTIYALGRFVVPGLIICDPMMGSGTTGVASLALGCAFIGSDSAPDCVTRVRKRINDARTAADGRPRPDQPPIPHFAEPHLRIRSHGESGLFAEPEVVSVS